MAAGGGIGINIPQSDTNFHFRVAASVRRLLTLPWVRLSRLPPSSRDPQPPRACILHIRENVALCVLMSNPQFWETKSCGNSGSSGRPNGDSTNRISITMRGDNFCLPGKIKSEAGLRDQKTVAFRWYIFCDEENRQKFLKNKKVMNLIGTPRKSGPRSSKKWSHFGIRCWGVTEVSVLGKIP